MFHLFNRRKRAAFLPLLLVLASCTSEKANSLDAGSSDIVTAMDTLSSLPTGSIKGRIVDADGHGLAGLKVLCCTSSLCVSGETESDGRYRFDDLEIYDESLSEARKMHVTDLSGAYMDIVFHQVVVAGEVRELQNDVAMTPDSGVPSIWDEDTGGTVVLAEGKLELNAPPESLIFPFGLNDSMIRAVSIMAKNVPPQDLEAWVGHEDETISFLINPLDIRSKEALGLIVFDDVEREAGSKFEVWSLNSSKGVMEKAGTASVQSDFRILGDDDLNLTRVSMIILVPMENP